MSWTGELDAELRARGVPARERSRIVAEFRDHIACEPGCERRLGDPRALAVSFADELAASKARGSALRSFSALAFAAVALAVSQLSIRHAGGYPGYSNGLSVWLFVPATLGMLVAPQVALVAGTLAAVRAMRRRHKARMPAAEIGLIRRRTQVALAAGLATMAGLELYVVNFAERLPGWWLGLVGGLAALAAAALLAIMAALARDGSIVCETDGRAGDIYDDLPGHHWRGLRRHPWRLGIIVAAFVVFAMTAFEAHAEHSLIEGVQRGVFEGLAAALGFAVLGRAIGALPTRHRAAAGVRASSDR